MSDKVRALVWDYYDEKRFGAPMVLALAISDEADDRGGLFQSVKELARKTRQAERSVRGQLRSLEESGLLECVERSPGGPGQYHRYQINLPLFLSAANPEAGSGLTRKQDPGLCAPNPEAGSGLADPSIYKESKELLGADVAPSRVDEVEDQRLAGWIFERIRALNPNHREPSWPAWRKDIRMMRTRDKHTRREIAELFAWANAHAFWQGNVLSPGALRRQWDRLELQRLRDGGRGVQAPGQKIDSRCCWDKGGSRCTRDGVFGHPDGRRYCAEHQEAEERERASANG